MTYDYRDYIKNNVIRSVVDECVANPFLQSVIVAEDDRGRTWSIIDQNGGQREFGSEDSGKASLLERIRNAVVLFFKFWSSTFRTSFFQAIQGINQANQNEWLYYEDSDNEEHSIDSQDEQEDNVDPTAGNQAGQNIDDEGLYADSEDESKRVSYSGKGWSVHQETFTISKKTLNEMDEVKTSEFWNFVSKSIVKRLEITLDDGDSVTYEKGFLKLFSDNKPSITDLFDMYTLQFNEGDLLLPKAQLCLCGDYFTHALDSGLAERTNKRFRFINDDDGISLEGFSDILRAIETEEYDLEDYPEDFQIAADYVQFSSPYVLPEYIIGRKLLEQHLGNVGEVPLPPKELLEALETPCPFSKDENIKRKDTHIALWVPKTIDNDILSLNRVEVLMKSKHPEDKTIGFKNMFLIFQGFVSQEEEGGYWLLMLKKPLDATENLTYKDAKTYMKDNFENYDVPLAIDVILCALLNYVCSGEEQERILPSENSLTFTWCKNHIVDPSEMTWQMVIGNFRSLMGLQVLPDMSKSHAIGVCPVMKFFP